MSGYKIIGKWVIFITLSTGMFWCPCFAFDPTNNASVSVSRADDQKVLVDAVVKVIPLEHAHHAKGVMGFTDAKGSFGYYFSAPVIIEISHLGFTTITDTVYTQQNKTYQISIASQNIQDVVVTGQYGMSKPEKSVYEVKVIDADMLRAKGATNLRDALQNELHMDFTQDPVFGSNLSINGISGEGVKILVDGVPIVGRMDGKLDLSQITLGNIERIEIVEGPLSVVYGTDAMGGVINVITKTYQKEKINLNLKAYYETVGQYNVEANGGFSFKKNQLFISAGRNFFDGYSAVKNASRSQDWLPKEQYFADAKYVYTGNRFRVSLAGSFLRELLLNRGDAEKTRDPATGEWTYSGIDGHYLTYRPRASASFMYKFKEGNQLDALLAYSGFIHNSTSYYKDLVTLAEKPAIDPNAPPDTTHYHAFVFRSTYSMPAMKDRINFQFGVDLNQEYAILTNIQGGSKTSGDYAAFGSVRFTIVEGLDIQPAIRFSYNTRFNVPLIPAINVRYAYKNKLVFRASYGRGYRAPSLKELYLSFHDSNHNLDGNPSLQPEDGNCFNTSLNYTLPIKPNHKLIFSAGGFYNAITNRIDFVQISDTSPVAYQYYNLKRYNTYGATASVTYEWKRLTVGVAASYTGYESSDTGSTDIKLKFWSPDVKVNAGYIIPKAEIGINVIYKYNGMKPLFIMQKGLTTGTRSAFNMLDISLTRNFWKNRIQLTVGGRNLLGVGNVKGTNISGPAIAHSASPDDLNTGWGRTFFTTLVLHFSK